jgi:DNA replication protein DnaC
MNLGVAIHTTPLERQGACETHGEYLSKCWLGDHWTGCNTCATEAEAAEKLQADEKAKTAARDKWLEKLGQAAIPDRFSSKKLLTYIASTDEQKQALAFAVQYANDFAEVLRVGRCAVFVGRRGTGKTHLACGIALRIMHAGYSAHFTSVSKAIRRIKDTWGKYSKESETQAIAAMVYPDLLILDEVGVQFGSETEKHLLFDLLNERYEKRKPTILISNLTRDELTGFIGERVDDRLREDGGEFVPFTWDSNRGN